MLPTDAELVDAAAATYTRTDPLAQDVGGAIRAFLTLRDDGTKVIAIEGTHDTLGWLIDFLAIPVEQHATAQHPTLGTLHAGFYSAAQVILPKIELAIKGTPWAITGHSLGAALALLIGALAAEDDNPPVKIAAFAPPRVGGPDFTAAISAISTSAYRFGDDPVTEVPFTFPPDFDYRQVPLIMIGAPIEPATRCHAIENYLSGVHTRETAKLSES